MGVLRLFKYLLDKYPDIVVGYKKKFKKFNPETPWESPEWFKSYNSNGLTNRDNDEKCEILMMDLNALFHPCCQKVFEYGSGLENVSFIMQKKKKEMNSQELEEMAFKMICNKIMEVYHISKPSKAIYLAVDSVAGSSKNSQQRQRRFRTAQSKVVNEYGFNSNSISAGTEFMDRLCKYIYNFILKKRKYDWKNLKIIFSDVNVPGEGEHKLVRYLETNRQFKKITIYSPDADLIMLGLTIKNSDVKILRENVYDFVNADYFFVDINKLKGGVVRDLKSENLNSPFSEEKIVRDYVFFSFMLGNDFLPHPNGLEISNKGIDILYQCYTHVYTEEGYLVGDYVNKIYVNKKPFIMLMEELAKLEPKMILDKSKHKNITMDKILKNHIVRSEQGDKIEFDAYREEYYMKKFNLEHLKDRKSELNQEIKKICRKYIEGMIYVLRYYFKGIPTFDWCYEYHYAPFFQDLLKTSIEMSKEEEGYPYYRIEFNPRKPLNLYESLMSVLPPSNYYLLPKNIEEQIKDKILLDADFIEEFESDMDGKYQEYEAISLVPFVSYDKIKKIFEGVSYTEEQENKIKIGCVYEFK